MSYFTIGQLAKKAQVHKETIRYYERRGLLSRPSRRDSGYRQYSEADVTRIRFIKRAQELGFSLKEISELLSLRIDPETACEDVKRRAETKIADIEEKMRTLQRMQQALTQLVVACNKRRSTSECPILEVLDLGIDYPEVSMQNPTVEEIAKILAERLNPDPLRLLVSQQLNRLLAQGQPVSIDQLALTLNLPYDQVTALLHQSPHIEYDELGNIVGAGLSLVPTPHRFQVNGHDLFTWCAMDTLFFPMILQQTAQVASQCPVTQEWVKLTVTPERIEHLEPPSAMVSVVIPEEACCNIRSDFCNHVHFFSSPEAAATWQTTHPGVVILPVAEAYRVGHLLYQYRLQRIVEHTREA